MSRSAPTGKLLAEWFWIDRWMGSSAFLLPIEPRGLYREMLSQAWRRGASLPNDPAAIRRAIGATEEEWARCWPVVERYWYVEGDRLINETQRVLYTEAQGMKQRASVRGKSGAAARTQALLEQKPPITDHQSPITDHQEREVHANAKKQFDRFWAVYPKKVGKDAAWAVWLRRSPANDLTDTIIASVERYKASPQWQREEGQYIPNPRTFLHQGRWQDEVVVLEPVLPANALSERAGNFCEWYAERHSEHFRVGYIGSPRSDYEAALRLVAKLTDDELHAAVWVWFGMDDEFATKGTRTIPKFASRATYCVEQARKVKVGV